MLRAGRGHLWELADRVGLYARPGEITVDDATGRLCGRWYMSLGSDIRAYGYTADTYRADMELCAGEPLTARTLSASIRDRQSSRYHRTEELRAAFAAGAARLPSSTGARSRPEPAHRPAPRRFTSGPEHRSHPT